MGLRGEKALGGELLAGRQVRDTAMDAPVGDDATGGSVVFDSDDRVVHLVS